jgi:Tol biopolymer transport system component
MKLRKILLCLVIVSLIVSMAIPMAAAKKPPKPPPDPADPAIAYRQSDILFVMNADGSNQVNIWENVGNPGWAPDGSAIAFGVQQEDYTNDLYRIDVTVVNGVPQGSNPIELAQEIKSPPQWSPAGDVIAFKQTLNGDYRLIQTVPATGGDIETIYTSPDGYGLQDFSWRYDASQMAILIGSDGQQSIVILDFSDGSTTTVYGPTGDWLGNIDWARTSDTLAFTGYIDGIFVGICTLDLTDPSAMPEILIAGQYKMPSWSPDDSQMALLKWERNKWTNLMVYDLATEEMERLAKGFAPDWCRA